MSQRCGPAALTHQWLHGSHISGLPEDKAKTVARIRVVLDRRSLRLSTTEKPFLDALLVYWGTVSDLVQRQEHGGQKEGTPLM
jgi:hypothetical protein